MAKISEKKKLKEIEERIERIEKDYPPHPADSYIIQRFLFEPRSEFQGGRKWMVIYDRVLDRYVRKESNPKQYMTFCNSWECVQYLRSKFKAKEE